MTQKKPENKNNENLCFECSKCSATCDSKEQLQMQINSIHPKRYGCKQCEQKFDTSSKLEQDLLVVHKDKKNLLYVTHVI